MPRKGRLPGQAGDWHFFHPQMLVQISMRLSTQWTRTLKYGTTCPCIAPHIASLPLLTISESSADVSLWGWKVRWTRVHTWPVHIGSAKSWCFDSGSWILIPSMGSGCCHDLGKAYQAKTGPARAEGPGLCKSFPCQVQPDGGISLRCWHPDKGKTRGGGPSQKGCYRRQAAPHWNSQACEYPCLRGKSTGSLPLFGCVEIAWSRLLRMPGFATLDIRSLGSLAEAMEIIDLTDSIPTYY